MQHGSAGPRDAGRARGSDVGRQSQTGSPPPRVYGHRDSTGSKSPPRNRDATGSKSPPRNRDVGGTSPTASDWRGSSKGSASPSSERRGSRTAPPNPYAELALKIDDVVELAVLGKLQDWDPFRKGQFSSERVMEVVKFALDVDSVENPDHQPLSYKISRPTRSGCLRLVGFVILALGVSFLLYWALSAAVHELTKQVSIGSEGQLVASSLGSSGSLVTTGSSVVLRSLLDYPALAVAELRRAQDAVFVHRGIWYCVRIARIQKYSDHHVVLSSSGGAAVRIRDGVVHFSSGGGGSWETVDPEETNSYVVDVPEEERQWLSKGVFDIEMPVPLPSEDPG